jgi:hypothetical protein
VVSDARLAECASIANVSGTEHSVWLISKRGVRRHVRGSPRYRAKQRERSKRRRKADINFRLTCLLRVRVCLALAGKLKAARTLELLGCTIEQLRAHLESLFLEGMSWDNHGEWEIDHIRPCASFDLTDPSQQRACFHYSNLQPLWWLDNIRKGAKWDGDRVHGVASSP